jgi:hypothetical protein
MLNERAARWLALAGGGLGQPVGPVVVLVAEMSSSPVYPPSCTSTMTSSSSPGLSSRGTLMTGSILGSLFTGKIVIGARRGSLRFGTRHAFVTRPDTQFLDTRPL